MENKRKILIEAPPIYEAPALEIVEVETEKGFACYGGGPGGGPGGGDDNGDDGDV